MRVFVKICGLSTPRAVSEAIQAGADAIGFVFAESPRQVTPKRAAQLCRDVSPAIIRVAVMRHPTQDERRQVAEEFAPDGCRPMRTIFRASIFPRASAVCRYFAIRRIWTSRYWDTKSSCSSRQLKADRVCGPTGSAPRNWSRAWGWNRHLVLAGGLTPENVGAAIATVRPYGVDVSSGVESRRGVKDPGRIAAFMAAVREAESNDAKR